MSLPRAKTRAIVMDSPGRKQFLLRLPHSLFESARSCADRENISITAYMNEAIVAYNATDEVKNEDAVAVPSGRVPSHPDVKWWM